MTARAPHTRIDGVWSTETASDEEIRAHLPPTIAEDIIRDKQRPDRKRVVVVGLGDHNRSMAEMIARMHDRGGVAEDILTTRTTMDAAITLAALTGASAAVPDRLFAPRSSTKASMTWGGKVHLPDPKRRAKRKAQKLARRRQR